MWTIITLMTDVPDPIPITLAASHVDVDFLLGFALFVIFGFYVVVIIGAIGIATDPTARDRGRASGSGGDGGASSGGWSDGGVGGGGGDGGGGGGC
ncbi:hypothetical protein ACFW4K_03415 [Nocardiopsis alba]|uniref:hypothetical protein n=1 Tax=Nocardiopsis alba TaxID=53437 RepID=UPI003672BFDC